MEVSNRWLGIDCGESRHHLALLSAEGQLEVSASVENQRVGIQAALQRLLSRIPDGEREIAQQPIDAGRPPSKIGEQYHLRIADGMRRLAGIQSC